MARNGHAESVAQCPLLGAKRKTCARIELFRFGPLSDITDFHEAAGCRWLWILSWQYGLERNLETTGAVEVIAALTSERLRHIHRQRYVVRHRRHNATRDAAIDMLRTTVRDCPVARYSPGWMQCSADLLILKLTRAQTMPSSSSPQT
jgi:hypothetical protein